MLKWENWFYGLISAVIGSVATSAAMMFTDPKTFNFDTGWRALWHLCIATGILSAAMFLKQSPLPAMVTTVTVTDTHTEAVSQTTAEKISPAVNPPATAPTESKDP